MRGDTHCYLVRPRKWWDAFREELPQQYVSVFAPPSALPDRFVREAGQRAAAPRKAPRKTPRKARSEER
jgi:hypothetical protein